MKVWPFAAAMMALQISGGAQGADLLPELTDFKLIQVKNGFNPIKRLSPDGLDGMVVKAWRENGNAHGHNSYQVLIKAGSEREPWYVVTFEHRELYKGQANSQVDLIRDDPHTFEDVLTSVTFGRVMADGKPNVVAVVAERDLDGAESLVDNTPVDVHLYRLTQFPDGIGWPPYFFDRVKSVRLKGRYGNANCALVRELAIPLPPEDVEGECPP